MIKARFSRRVNRRRRQAAAEQAVLWQRVRESVWQKRFYDFNVWSTRKRVEKLRYMHRNWGPRQARFWHAGVESL